MNLQKILGALCTDFNSKGPERLKWTNSTGVIIE